MIGELDKEHVNIVLQTHHVGRLACCLENTPYIVPVTYVYQDGYIYGHTNEGRKTDILRRNPRVCLEVDDIDSMNKWRSVVVTGKFEELDGQASVAALDILFERLKPLVTSESAKPYSDNQFENFAHHIKLKNTKGVTYRIRIDKVSGRYERP